MGNKFEMMVSPDSENPPSHEWREEIDHEKSVDAAADWVSQMLEDKDDYSERIPLKRDQSFDVPQDVTELPMSVSQLVRSAYRMEMSQSGLYELAKEISKKNPDIRFTFKRDPQGKWIEYTAEKMNFKVGDEVLWENQGALHWDEGKRITSIRLDPNSKQKFAFFEGSTTGVPLNELIPVDKEKSRHA